MPTIPSPPLRRLLWPLLAAGLLFGLFSIARECLVPHGADFDRARWRLTGDEPAYLLTAPRPWIVGDRAKARRAALFSRDFTGRAAVVLLEEEPEVRA